MLKSKGGSGPRGPLTGSATAAFPVVDDNGNVSYTKDDDQDTQWGPDPPFDFAICRFVTKIPFCQFLNFLSSPKIDEVTLL